jgi:hypothetical protein
LFVKQKLLLPCLGIVLIMLLSACHRLDTPTPGTYRAHVNVRGGEVPFELQISEQQGVTTLGIQRGDSLSPVTRLKLQGGTLEAELPDAAGALHVDIGRDALHGELRLVDPHGKPVVLPFAAELNKRYRFIEQPVSDNADIAGDWILEAISPEHFAEPVRLHLQQRFDAVDGQLQLRDGKQLTIVGQVHGDEVYLSSLGHGRALLFKGKVNAQGELQGEVWANLSNVKTWAAKRLPDEQAQAASGQEEHQRVALPWAIPPQ